MTESFRKPLVIGISSRALLNLEKEDALFRSSKENVKEFIDYQRDHQEELIAKGVAFPLVKSLLQLNEHFSSPAASSEPAIQVVIISRNHPDCGLRILRSLSHYGLDIPKAAFTGGESILPELRMFDVDLFLSCEDSDVIAAGNAGISSAKIFGGPVDLTQFEDSSPLLAFDGDSTIFSDEADVAFLNGGTGIESQLEAFAKAEFDNLGVPLKEGPIYRFVKALAQLQDQMDIQHPQFRIALVTARNFGFMQRPIETLRTWGIRLDKAYFIGNMKKQEVLRNLNPVMFFDDNIKHCEGASQFVPTARIISQNVSVPVQDRLQVFAGLCKLVLKKDYSKHEQTLISMYEARVNKLGETTFTESMDEIRRSIAGTPKGRLVEKRQAVGPKDTEFFRLKSFLDNLFTDCGE